MTRATSRHTITLLAIIVITLTGLAGQASAATAPVKEILSTRFGWDVNKTKENQNAPQSERNVCSVASGNECQAALTGEGPSLQGPSGLEYPETVAVNDDSPATSHHGDVYVTDRGHHRIQEFTPAGVFVSMIGWDVNKTKVNAGGATQQEMNICTASEIKTGAECQAGSEAQGASAQPGQFGSTMSGLAIDPENGDIYIAEIDKGPNGRGERIQKLTPTGELVYEIGKKVNQTTGANLCTQQEIITKHVNCAGPEEHSPLLTDAEPLSFGGQGAVLAVGGSEHLLYVGEEHRVKIFKADGTDTGKEITLAGFSSQNGARVTTLAVDTKGAAYLTYENANAEKLEDTIRKFDSSEKELTTGAWPLTLKPRTTNTPGVTVRNFIVSSLAVDSSGRLAVSDVESLALGTGGISVVKWESEGSLLDGVTGALVTAFPDEFTTRDGFQFWDESLAFSSEDDLYGLSVAGGEVVGYVHVPVGELVGGPAACAEGDVMATDVTVDCELKGSVDPWGVTETEAWFEWGVTPVLGEMSAPQHILNNGSEGEEEPLAPVASTITGLAPGETVFYRLAAHDSRVKTPELLTSTPLDSFTASSVPPRVTGGLGASLVSASSALVFGELNPENTSSEYYFEYGPCKMLAGCGTIGKTRTVSSSAYAQIGTAAQITGLQPETTYSYRLAAVNEKGQDALNATGEPSLPEATFTTAPAPTPQGITGTASNITPTSANIAGTVDPDGGQAAYEFQIGVYTGASTQYGVVFSGSAGAGTIPVTETLALTGLQPGTTYAFRIAIKSGYVKNQTRELTGQTVLFTTQGLPSELSSPPTLPLLETPQIAFPKTIGQTNRKKNKKTKKKLNSKKLGRKPAANNGARKHNPHKGKK